MLHQQDMNQETEESEVRPRRVDLTRLCLVCGHQFAIDTRHPKQKFCGPECFYKNRSLQTLEKRFWKKVVKSDDPNGCWLWIGAKAANGYGIMRKPGKVQQVAHRTSYELLVGPIPEDLTIHHICKNKLCINPAHLVALTHYEHVHLHHPSKTHCKWGHPFDRKNTNIRKTNGERRCRTCAREKQARYRAAKLLTGEPTRYAQWKKQHPNTPTTGWSKSITLL